MVPDVSVLKNSRYGGMPAKSIRRAIRENRLKGIIIVDGEKVEENTTFAWLHLFDAKVPRELSCIRTRGGGTHGINFVTPTLCFKVPSSSLLFESSHSFGSSCFAV